MISKMKTKPSPYDRTDQKNKYLLMSYVALKCLGDASGYRSGCPEIENTWVNIIKGKFFHSCRQS